MKAVARLLLLLGLALAAGCAGIIEPQLPSEFRGRKQKEDPPLTLLTVPRPGPREART